LDSKEFVLIRNRLNKTQKQMAVLLGTSVQAIHSYEQGWRSVPVHIERQTFFLFSRLRDKVNNHKPCWIINDCPDEYRDNCPAWEFAAGDFCWLINGTFCKGSVQKSWQEKMKICRTCKVLTSMF